jgi:ribosomal protein S12 methylthiotransferase
VDLEEAEIAVVNTCAFILPAVEESIESVLEIHRAAPDRKIIVAGCLPQRFGEDLFAELGEVQYIMGVGSISKIGEIVSRVARGERGRSLCEPISPLPSGPRYLLSPPHYAYLKIADGCSNRCAYCLIPSIRGEFRSRPPHSILEEARRLAGRGVKELILVAQDTSLWGTDLDRGSNLPGLIRSLAALEGIEWIRILYLHPAHLPRELGRTIAESRKACNYVDLPIQHISDRILAGMNRGVTGREIKQLIDILKHEIPGLALRSTVMVGFPGETDEEFGDLVSFVEEAKFDALGIFRHSVEDGTVSSGMDAVVDDEIVEERITTLHEVQREISFHQNLSQVGTVQRVLVDAREADRLRCRTERQAPEVDGVVYVEDCELRPGEFADVTVVRSDDYDLFGRALL